jgi:ADP-heptose:LPS heptosyltransferase
VLASAIIRELKHIPPGSHITFICTNSNRAMAEMVPEIDQIVVFNPARPLDSFKLIRSLAKFDILFDFGPWPRVNSIISYLTRSSFKVGFKRRGMFRHYIYDSSVTHTDKNHEIDNYRNLLRAARIKPIGMDPYLRINGNLSEKHRQYFVDNTPNIIMHPFPAGAKGHLREWPIEKWIELGVRLADDGCNVMISGGRKDTERAEEIYAILRLPLKRPTF